MSCVCPGSVQRWLRPSRPPGATWSERSLSKEDAISWTPARGGHCWVKTPYKVCLDSLLISKEDGCFFAAVDVEAHVLLPVVTLNTNQVPVQSWTYCDLRTESGCSTSATPRPNLTPRPATRPRCQRACQLRATLHPLASSRRRWQCGEVLKAPRRPSDHLRRTRANKRATSCT